MSAVADTPASERAQAYIAMLGMLAFEAEPSTLGTCAEKWALFMTGSDASRPALVAALRVIRERTPVVSLIRACVLLDLDLRDVMADD